MNQAFRFFPGDDIELEVCVTDEDNQVVDITGYLLVFTLKRNEQDSDAQAVYQTVVTNHTDPTQGESLIVIPSEDSEIISPGLYYYDVQVETSDGRIKTLIKGCIKFVGEITKTNDFSSSS